MSGGFDFAPDEWLNTDDNISSVEPVEYQQRFMSFVKHRVCSDGTRQKELEEERRRVDSRTRTGGTGGGGGTGGRGLGTAMQPLVPVAPPVSGPSGPSGPSGHRSQDPSFLVPMAPMVEEVEAVAATRAYRVTVPLNVHPGMSFTIQANALNYTIACPPNAGPGMVVEIQLPV